VQAGGLYPISDVWYIDPGLDTPERLRIHIAQFARDRGEADPDECIDDRPDGIGFACRAHPNPAPLGRAVLRCWLAWPVSSPPTSVDIGQRHRPAAARCTAGRRNPAIERHRAGQAVSAAAAGPPPARSEAGAADWNVSEEASMAPPLNQAVIAQALYDLRNGQLRRCKLMGFRRGRAGRLKHRADQRAGQRQSPWCSVTVNREVLRRLLQQAQDVEKEIATVDRMLRLGASTEMVSRFYGLTHQEVALRREILGLPKRKGASRWTRAGHGAVAAMEGRDQQQERRSKTKPPSSMPPWTWPKACRCLCRWSGPRSRAGSIRDWLESWPWTTPHHESDVAPSHSQTCSTLR
jgi:hypothetical protein